MFGGLGKTRVPLHSAGSRAGPQAICRQSEQTPTA